MYVPTDALPPALAPLQACSLLVTPNKSELGLEDVLQVCPDLNVQQLYRLCTTCWDDSGAARHDGVAGEVLEEMKRHNVTNNGGGGAGGGGEAGRCRWGPETLSGMEGLGWCRPDMEDRAWVVRLSSA